MPGAKAGDGKVGKQKALVNFLIATASTIYNHMGSDFVDKVTTLI
jgi:hypothetical protein